MIDNHPSHINSYVHRILDIIKKDDRPFTFKEIYNNVGVNLLANMPLMKALRNNPKIFIDQESLKFMPLYNIRSTFDLEEILKNNGGEGIEMSKLSDSPVDIKPFVVELREQNKIFLIKDMDNSEIVFYNDLDVRPACAEIRGMWNMIKIHNYHDMVVELNSAGLKNASTQTVLKKAVVKKEPKKRSQRRIRITNTHVKGLDLSGMNDDYN